METTIISSQPLIIRLKLTSLSNPEETRSLVTENQKVLRELSGPYHLLLDLLSPDSSPYNLDAHRIWALGIKENPLFRSQTVLTAVIGNKSEHFEHEKKLLESEKLQFFYQYEDALAWLMNNPIELENS